MSEEQEKRLLVLHKTIKDVSSFVFSSFQAKQFSITAKEDGSEVTNIDLEAELQARESILQTFPNDGFLGEEHGEVKGSTSWRWVIDPIDGTASFARGVPLFGTLIGLEFEGEPFAGVAILPAIGESIFAVTGEGAWHTPANTSTQVKAQVSNTETLGNSMICTTTFDYYQQTNCEPMFQELLRIAGSTRGWSDCYSFLLMCTGRIDAVVEPLLFPWDIIPWIPIIKESGGNYSSIIRGGIASNPHIHRNLYDALHANITN